MCDSGKWQCSENFCPSRCLIEGHFVTTFDGKQYVVPGKCSYVASQVQISPNFQHFTFVPHRQHIPMLSVFGSDCPLIALKGPDWVIMIEFSAKAPSLKKVVLHIFEVWASYISKNVKK